MKRTVGFLVFTLAFIAALYSPAPAQSPSSKGTSQDKYLLKLAGWFPGTGHTGIVKWIGDQIELRTNNRVTVDEYFSGSLIPATQELPAIEKGIADIAAISPHYSPGRIPLWGIVGLHGFIPDLFGMGKAMTEFAELPIMKEELAKVNAIYLAPMGTPAKHLISNKPVQRLDDMKGMKVRAVADEAKIMKSIGAVPVFMPMPEVYTALQKKTIEGVLHATASHVTFKWYETCKYFTKLDYAANGWFLVVNKNTWAKLPGDIQQIMKEVCSEWSVVWTYAYQVKGEQEAFERIFPQGGVKVIEMPEGERAKLKEQASKPLWDEYAKDLEKKGLPGKEMMNKWYELSQKWAKASPFRH